ncbi:uncharacterized protein LOC113520683 [Galleria mellonella]|uniref:Uncharacterized protein LOC113520683 n=1 Tax=Galleria mellonella TaxID=7137 RepID=A0A6J3BXZ6_GALME|nr:uncharacterized protein LOC113520683 [Galleria mellonella]
MDSIEYNYAMEDSKQIFTTATDTKATVTAEIFTPSDNRTAQSGQESVFSPLASSFQTRGGNELLNILAQQEPRAADTAPSAAEIDEVFMNYRINGNDMLFDENANYFTGTSRPESMGSAQTNTWMDNSTMGASRNGEIIDTFDFLMKSLSSANNYVSMLTREQLAVLRSIRPALLYEFLQEVAKVRSDKRMRRALPNECAFCKNNGENEECYSSHALKDWRGRVLCPVLRAFRCPRCGATGDRAHTIKYCPENMDTASDRSMGSLSSRRRIPPSLLLGSPAVGHMAELARNASSNLTASSPSPSVASASFSHSALWSSFGIN